jgi:putative spermidine/putrescine transport system permease protein
VSELWTERPRPRDPERSSLASIRETRLAAAWPTRSDPRERGRFRVAVLVMPALAVLIVVYAIPVGEMFLLSLTGAAPFSQYARVFGDVFVLNTLQRTIRIAIEVTLLCLLLGYPIAFLMLKSSPRMRGVITLLVILPVWTSVLVRSYAWIVILGRHGIVNALFRGTTVIQDPLPLLYNRFSVYVGMVHIMLPFMILPLFAAMRRIDLGLVRAARSLGAGAVGAFLWIFLPLSLPGVSAGSLLVFVLSLGFFVTPALLGGLRDVTYVMLVEKQVNELLNWPLASAMSVVLLLLTLILVIVYQRFFGFDTTGRAHEVGAGRGMWLQHWFSAALIATNRAAEILGIGTRGQPDSASTRLSPHAGSLWTLISWLVIFFLAFPILLLFPLAFSASPYLEFPPAGFSLQWFRNYFGRADWTNPTITSLKVATLTMLVALPVGMGAALGLVRGQFRGRSVLMAFLVSPMVVPTIIVAVALYFLFGRVRLIGTQTGLVLGHLVLAIPMVIVVLVGALRTVDETLERAAGSLGASPLTAFVRVTLPLLRPSILTAAFFAFLASFDEVVIALFISGTAAATLPKRMWDGIRFEVDPTTAAASALLIMFSGVLLAVAEVARTRARRHRPGNGTEGPYS